jgi:hypothetical protein
MAAMRARVSASAVALWGVKIKRRSGRSALIWKPAVAHDHVGGGVQVAPNLVDKKFVLDRHFGVIGDRSKDRRCQVHFGDRTHGMYLLFLLVITQVQRFNGSRVGFSICNLCFSRWLRNQKMAAAYASGVSYNFHASPTVNLDGLVVSLKMLFSVIPANPGSMMSGAGAGIQQGRLPSAGLNAER